MLWHSLSLSRVAVVNGIVCAAGMWPEHEKFLSIVLPKRNPRAFRALCIPCEAATLAAALGTLVFFQVPIPPEWIASEG